MKVVLLHPASLKALEKAKLLFQSCYAVGVSRLTIMNNEKLPQEQISYFIDKVLSPSEFFEMVQETNKEFMDEERIEQRDIDMGLLDR